MGTLFEHLRQLQHVLSLFLSFSSTTTLSKEHILDLDAEEAEITWEMEPLAATAGLGMPKLSIPTIIHAICVRTKRHFRLHNT